jgi:putative DNA primase/helicase
VPGLNHTGFAFYDDNRYFTFSGAVHSQSGDIGTVDFTALHAELFPATPRTGSSSKPSISLGHSELLMKARSARNGAAFARLFAGNWEGDYASQSEADMALCCHLAFWTGRDAGRMDALYPSVWPVPR